MPATASGEGFGVGGAVCACITTMEPIRKTATSDSARIVGNCFVNGRKIRCGFIAEIVSTRNTRVVLLSCQSSLGRDWGTLLHHDGEQGPIAEFHSVGSGKRHG